MTARDKWASDPDYARFYARSYAEESLIQDAEEMLLKAMDDAGVNRAELARRLGVDRAAVTRYFQSALTLRTVAAICFVLGVTPKLSIERPAEFAARDGKV